MSDERDLLRELLFPKRRRRLGRRPWDERPDLPGSWDEVPEEPGSWDETPPP